MENKIGIDIKDLGEETSNRANNPIDPELPFPKIPPQKDNSSGVYDQLNQLFTDQDKEKKTILEAREILGDSAEILTDSQVYDLVNEIQYLVDSWLEEYERKVFEGKTLNELIGLKK